MRVLSLVLILVLMVCPAAWADGPARVVTQAAKISGTEITALSKAAAADVSNTDAIWVVPSEQHSVGVTVTATQAVSLTVTAQGSFDGTNFTGFTPAVAATFSLSSTTARGIAALSLPVVPYVRFTLSSDASYPVIYTNVTLGRW